MQPILLRYGEIGLKSPRIRKRFEQTLINTIETVFQHHQLDCVIERQWGRMILYTDTIEPASGLLRKIFGIVSFSPVHETTADIDALTALAVKLSKDSLTNSKSFAIRARRSGTHSFSSMDIARSVGAAVLDVHDGEDIHVDLGDPDVEIFIEVRDKYGYVFMEVIPGPGGLPVGTQGKAVVIIHELRSLLAAWMMMKRGCHILPIIFLQKIVTDSSATVSSDDAHDISLEYLRFELLQEWFLGLEPCIRELERLPNPSDERVPSITHEMLTEAFAYADKKNASALVTSETKTQIARIIARTDTPVPIFYPLIGFDEDEIDDLFAEIFQRGVGSGE